MGVEKNVLVMKNMKKKWKYFSFSRVAEQIEMFS